MPIRFNARHYIGDLPDFLDLLVNGPATTGERPATTGLRAVLSKILPEFEGNLGELDRGFSFFDGVGNTRPSITVFSTDHAYEISNGKVNWQTNDRGEVEKQAVGAIQRELGFHPWPGKFMSAVGLPLRTPLRDIEGIGLAFSKHSTIVDLLRDEHRIFNEALLGHFGYATDQAEDRVQQYFPYLPLLEISGGVDIEAKKKMLAAVQSTLLLPNAATVVRVEPLTV